MSVGGTPISVVIPAFNRERVVGRAIRSALGEDDPALEVIVVDDGSSDRTPEVVARFADPRVKLIEHSENRGVCAARNTAIDAASGRWVVFLDSDDELLPGALSTIRREIADTDGAVARLLFMYRLDSGDPSPQPELEEACWDLRAFLEWKTTLTSRTDCLNVVRASALRSVRFPEGHPFEEKFHLDFQKRFLTRTVPTIVALMHDDAQNRSSRFGTGGPVAVDHPSRLATREILEDHGPALRRWAPNVYRNYRLDLASWSFYDGFRREGISHCVAVLRHMPTDLQAWLIMAAGVLGARPLSLLRHSIAERYQRGAEELELTRRARRKRSRS